MEKSVFPPSILSVLVCKEQRQWEADLMLGHIKAEFDKWITKKKLIRDKGKLHVMMYLWAYKVPAELKKHFIEETISLNICMIHFYIKHELCFLVENK